MIGGVSRGGTRDKRCWNEAYLLVNNAQQSASWKQYRSIGDMYKTLNYDKVQSCKKSTSLETQASEHLVKTRPKRSVHFGGYLCASQLRGSRFITKAHRGKVRETKKREVTLGEGHSCSGVGVGDGFAGVVERDVGEAEVLDANSRLRVLLH